MAYLTNMFLERTLLDFEDRLVRSEQVRKDKTLGKTKCAMVRYRVLVGHIRVGDSGRGAL